MGVPLNQTELALEIEPDPATLPIPLREGMKEVLLDWSRAVAGVIDGIGSPGDFGYGTKRGAALHYLIQIVREIQDVVAGRKTWTLKKQRGAASCLRGAVNAVEKLTWPKDVSYRLSRFYAALDVLKEKTALVEREVISNG